MTASFERNGVVAAVILAIALVMAVAVVGVLALRSTPVLVDDSGVALGEDDARRIRRVNDIALDADFTLQVPEFTRRADEDRWWQTHRRAYETLAANGHVTVELLAPDGTGETRRYRTEYLSLLDITRRLGLTYLAALLYLLTAVSVLTKDRAPHTLILSAFALAGALFLASGAAVASRGLTLAFPHFKLLFAFHHIGSAFLITLVHYALVFPRRKQFLDKLPIPPSVILYGHALVTTALYQAGTTAFGATLPNLLFWSAVMAGAFLHSLLTERDRFLRRQLALSLAVPLFVTAVYIFLHTLPGVVRATQIAFSTFALFAVMLPLSLSAAMDNVRLYRQRLAAEARARLEHEKIRRDLHDDTLNRLAGIALLTETSLASVDKDSGATRRRLQSIKERAADYARQIRGLLWITDAQCGTWDDLGSQLRSYGYELTGERGIEFQLALSQGGGANTSPSPAIKVCLYRVFAEALANALKHADAREITGRLAVGADAVTLDIRDDGVGFTPGCTNAGHYGLNNMRTRAEELGGTLTLDSRPGAGAGVRVTLPLTPDYRN
jgi:signal transduction histidine kinase